MTQEGKKQAVPAGLFENDGFLFGDKRIHAQVVFRGGNLIH